MDKKWSKKWWTCKFKPNILLSQDQSLLAKKTAEFIFENVYSDIVYTYSSARLCLWYNESDFVLIIIYEFLVFRFQTVFLLLVLGGGGVPKGPKGAFKAQLWASRLPPPCWYSISWNQYFLISEFVLGFPLLVSKYFEDIMYKY